jgi:hypothetical protein
MVPLEVKGEVNVPTSYTLPTTATSVVNTPASRMLFLTPSGAYVGSYVFYWTGINWVQAINQTATVTIPGISTNVPATTNSGYNFDNFSTDAAMTRNTYKSTTFYLNATEFNNQGTVTSAKFKPSIINGTIEDLSKTLHPDDIKKIRKLIAKTNKPSQPDRQSKDAYDYSDAPPKAEEYDYNIQILDFPFHAGSSIASVPLSNSYLYTNIFPSTPSDLMVVSPKGNTRPAKDGAFVVQQPVQDIQPWIQVQDTSASTGPMSPIGTVYSIIRLNNGSTYEYAPVWSSTAPIGSGPNRNGDTTWNNLDWSMTMFDGLSLPSTGTTTVVSAPYITVKTYLGLEIQPRFTSSLLCFLRMLPMPDRAAIEMAVGLFHARPDSLPASANDLASIASTVMKYLPTAVGWAKDLFGSKESKGKALDKAAAFMGTKRSEPKVVREEKKVVKTDNKLASQVASLTKQIKDLKTGGTTLPTYSNRTEADRYSAPPKKRVVFSSRVAPNVAARSSHRPSTPRSASSRRPISRR